MKFKIIKTDKNFIMGYGNPVLEGCHEMTKQDLIELKQQIDELLKEN